MTWTPQPLTELLGPRPPAWSRESAQRTKGGAPASAHPLKGRVVGLRGSDDAQAIAKVKLLGTQIVKAALDPTKPTGLAATRSLLSEALQGAPSKVNGHRKSAQAVRIFEWVKSRIRYVNDPVGMELFTAVPEAFQRGYGDCDDFTAILAALFLAAGIPAKARIIQHRGAKGWSHIYPIAFLDGKWRAFDGTESAWNGRRVNAGWEFPSATKKLDVELI